MGERLHTLADISAGLSGWKGWGRIALQAEKTGQRHGGFGDVHGTSYACASSYFFGHLCEECVWVGAGRKQVQEISQRVK